MTTRQHSMRWALTAVSMALLTSALNAGAATATWVGGDQGIWEAAQNWSVDGSALVPGPNDLVRFLTPAMVSLPQIEVGGLEAFADVQLMAGELKVWSNVSTDHLLQIGSGELPVDVDLQSMVAPRLTFLAPDAVLGGSGETRLVGAILEAKGNLTIAEGHVLSGQQSGLAWSGEQVERQLLNLGTLKATQGAFVLSEGGLSIDNHRGVLDIAEGASIRAPYGLIAGGVVRGGGTGAVLSGFIQDARLQGVMTLEGVSMRDVVISGTARVVGAVASGRLQVDGTLAIGDFLGQGIEADPPIYAELAMDGNVVLAGAGRTTMNAVSLSTRANNVLTIEQGHTLIGNGNLYGEGVDAGSALVNEGRIVASGGYLNIAATKFDNRNGVVQVEEGADLMVNFTMFPGGATFQGGVIEGGGGEGGGISGNFNDVTLRGTLRSGSMVLMLAGDTRVEGSLILGGRPGWAGVAYFADGARLSGPGQTILKQVGNGTSGLYIQDPGGV